MTPDRYEVSTVVQRLPGQREARGGVSGMGVVAVVIFAIAFSAVGAFVMLMGTKTIHVKADSVNAPYWVLTVFGGVFLVVGLWAWGLLFQQIRSDVGRRNHQGDPVMADYPWDRRGFEISHWKMAARGWAWALFLTLFLSIFNWAVIHNEASIFPRVIIGLFDLVALFLWFHAVRLSLAALKFGVSRIHFVEFPYRRGPVVIEWLPPAKISKINSGSFTLRQVQQWIERRGSGKNESSVVVHQQEWSGTWWVDSATSLTRFETISLKFELPADARLTLLRAVRPVFWELEVKLDLPGLDFEGNYLVPVYE